MKKIFLISLLLLLFSGCTSKKNKVFSTYNDILKYVNSNDYKINCEFIGNYLASKNYKITQDDSKKIRDNQDEFLDKIEKICKINGFKNRKEFAEVHKEYLNEPEIFRVREEINTIAIKINTEASKKSSSSFLNSKGLFGLGGILAPMTDLMHIDYGKSQAKQFFMKIEE